MNPAKPLFASEPLRPIVSDDLADVLALNNAVVPHVNELNLEGLEKIVEECALAVIAPHDGTVAGFVIAFPPNAPYESPNYRYFCGRYEQFCYVDRIAVDPGGHRGGVGRRLYEAVFAHAAEVEAERVCCEVNINPPNPVSQQFHARLGFVEVDRRDNYGGEVTVQMLAREIAS